MSSPNHSAPFPLHPLSNKRPLVPKKPFFKNELCKVVLVRGLLYLASFFFFLKTYLRLEIIIRSSCAPPLACHQICVHRFVLFYLYMLCHLCRPVWPENNNDEAIKVPCQLRRESILSSGIRWMVPAFIIASIVSIMGLDLYL